jgi:uncharacterized protein (DUF1330 family)
MMNIYKNKVLAIFTFGIFLFISEIASGQEYSFPELKGFKITTSYPVYSPDNLWDYIDGAADTYLAFGFEDLHIAEYTRGKNVIRVEIYRHIDDTQAFGMYSTERFPSYHFIDIGVQGYSTDGQVFFLKGNYYVKVMTNSKSAKILESVEPLAYKVEATIKGQKSMPELIKAFPEEGKKVYEETYVHESVLGHSFLTAAFKANYEVNGQTFSIFIMEKGSVEDSRKTVSDYLVSLKQEPVDPNGGKYVLEDGYNGTVFLSWNGKRIVLISGLSKDQTGIADKYSSLILK